MPVGSGGTPLGAIGVADAIQFGTVAQLGQKQAPPSKKFSITVHKLGTVNSIKRSSPERDSREVRP